MMGTVIQNSLEGFFFFKKNPFSDGELSSGKSSRLYMGLLKDKWVQGKELIEKDF